LTEECDSLRKDRENLIEKISNSTKQWAQEREENSKLLCQVRGSEREIYLLRADNDLLKTEEAVSRRSQQDLENRYQASLLENKKLASWSHKLYRQSKSLDNQAKKGNFTSELHEDNKFHAGILQEEGDILTGKLRRTMET
jgi:hypothetical protein